MPRDFTINAISASNAEFTKLNGAPMVPVLLTTPGPISIRQQTQPYNTFAGEKKET